MMFTEIREALRQPYLEDERPWLAGFTASNVNSYYDNSHDTTQRFDFANPPFNVNAVDNERLKHSARPGCRPILYLTPLTIIPVNVTWISQAPARRLP
jgi:hypothetical protein